MGPSPTCHPPKVEESETSVEYGLPLWAEPAVGYCSRRPRPSPMWGSRFVGARAVGPWVAEQKPLGKTPLGGNPSPDMTYLPYLSEECVCEPPQMCLCCHRPPETVERDLLYAYQGLKDTTKDAEPVEDHLPASIHQGASNLHSDGDMGDKIKLLDPRIQKLMRTYREVFGEIPPQASCDKLVQMDLKVKPEFVGHKIRRRPYPAPKEQANEIERQIQ